MAFAHQLLRSWKNRGFIEHRFSGRKIGLGKSHLHLAHTPPRSAILHGQHMELTRALISLEAGRRLRHACGCDHAARHQWGLKMEEFLGWRNGRPEISIGKLTGEKNHGELIGTYSTKNKHRISSITITIESHHAKKVQSQKRQATDGKINSLIQRTWIKIINLPQQQSLKINNF